MQRCLQPTQKSWSDPSYTADPLAAARIDHMNTSIFDTHFHIIDFRFPVTENQGFMPPSFPVEDYRKRTAGLGIVAGVVVTGSFQNFDTAFMRDALARFGPTFVGVAQLPADVPD